MFLDIAQNVEERHLMNIRIETMDWLIWLVVIVPIIGFGGYVYGVEIAMLLALLLPAFVIIKNEFLRSKHGWKASYSVGIAMIDDDHKKLLAMVWNMFKALDKAHGTEQAETVLRELAEYTVTHFDREEKLMEKHQFPDLANHHREHEAMKAKVKEFQDKFSSNSVEVSREMLRYLQEWLFNHISKTDKAYSEYLLARGER
ncbi:MAG: hemerythrin family protein [Magnetococcales bacterium]|nr:hemerythrin family protein [Magnetococcales bacterium]